MGRFGYGPIWLWAEMTRNHPQLEFGWQEIGLIKISILIKYEYALDKGKNIYNK